MGGPHSAANTRQGIAQMTRPNFICLCATYNHRQEWTENLVQLFLNQDYAGNAVLVLLDDREHGLQAGRKSVSATRSVDVWRAKRKPTLMDKYNWGHMIYACPDTYFCVLDDDDIYLPGFLSSHAKVLETHAWSYPEKIWSTYGHDLKQEASGGRFWASTAYTQEALVKAGGYGNSGSAGFDQLFLKRMREANGEPGKPDSVDYVYNWELTFDSHTSGHMKSFDDTTWYTETKESPASGPLSPKLNSETVEVLQKLGY